jgi:hypothetical protein
MFSLNKLNKKKDNCLKVRNDLIKCVLSDRRVYLSDLKLVCLKHLLRLDIGLINNDKEIISFYSGLATLNTKDYHDKLSTYKEDLE